MTDLTADQILKVTSPIDIFGTNEVMFDKIYKSLVKKWHPDISGRNDVMAHLNVLKAKCVKMQVVYYNNSETGSEFSYKFNSTIETELGRMRIGNMSVGFEFDSEFDLRNKYSQVFPYQNSDMEKEFSRYLPKVVHKFDNAVIIDKPSGLYPLSEVFAKFNGKVPPGHVAWIVSSLLDLNCYLKWAGISHNAILMDSIFVSPDNHSTHLLGGWEFSTKVDETLKILPSSTMNNTNIAFYKKRANSRIDGDLIKYLARCMIGGTVVTSSKELPISFSQWLTDPTEKDSLKLYRDWDQKLLKAFGPKKFLKLEM